MKIERKKIHELEFKIIQPYSSPGDLEVNSTKGVVLVIDIDLPNFVNAPIDGIYIPTCGQLLFDVSLSEEQEDWWIYHIEHSRNIP